MNVNIFYQEPKAVKGFLFLPGLPVNKFNNPAANRRYRVVPNVKVTEAASIEADLRTKGCTGIHSEVKK